MTVIGNLGDAPGPQDAGSRRLPPLEIAALNAFSARCAAYVLNKHPEWAPFASSEGDILFLDIPSPVPGRSLWMTTYADEVTIGLTPGMWHEHFNAASLECTDEALFASAMVWIDEIVAEEVLIVETQTQEHETRTWTTVRRDCKITPPPRGRKIVLSSWRGTYDREIRSRRFRWF